MLVDPENGSQDLILWIWIQIYDWIIDPPIAVVYRSAEILLQSKAGDLPGSEIQDDVLCRYPQGPEIRKYKYNIL